MTTVNSKQLTVNSKAFTLIELLVSISIIAVLISLSVFGLSGARESGRDTQRKSDLEVIRSGLEIYKSDCDLYPLSLPASGSALVGDGSTSTCLVTNDYIANIPNDPLSPARSYYYDSPDGETYELCAALESGGSDSCGGSCGEVCNYQTTNP